MPALAMARISSSEFGARFAPHARSWSNGRRSRTFRMVTKYVQGIRSLTSQGIAVRQLSAVTVVKGDVHGRPIVRHRCVFAAGILPGKSVRSSPAASNLGDEV